MANEKVDVVIVGAGASDSSNTTFLPAFASTAA